MEEPSSHPDPIMSPANALPAATSLSKSKSAPPNTALQNALDVRIDVKGAYIVDDEPSDDEEWKYEEDYQHDTNDIRLPHHRSLVSHMAVDVRLPPCTA
jgi:type II pantothenate kinase